MTDIETAAPPFIHRMLSLVPKVPSFVAILAAEIF